MGDLDFYPRIAKHDLTLCVKVDHADNDDADSRQLQGPEKMIRLAQGDNSCWHDAMAVAMRMHGIGRLAYDASDDSKEPNASLLELLRADWSTFVTQDDTDKYREPLLQQISLKSAGQIKSGGMANPGDLWDYGAFGIPSVSFNTIKKKICAECGGSTYYQTPQDKDVNCLQLIETTGQKRSVSKLLNAHFADQSIKQGKTDFTNCEHCKHALPLVQKTVVLDRPPHILCVAIPSAKDNLPDLSNPKELLDGVKMKFENFKGEEREIFYKTVSLVYLDSPKHWVVANFVQWKANPGVKNAQANWFVFDGMKDVARRVDGRQLNHKITSGAVTRILFKRVYQECDEGSRLK